MILINLVGRAVLLALFICFGQRAYAAGNTDEISMAIWQNDLSRVRSLMRTGANVNAALLVAVASDRKEIVSLLITHNADVNFKDTPHGETALFSAVDSASPEIVAMLIKAKADPNAQDSEGRTILMRLLMGRSLPEGGLRIAQQLLAAGADVNGKDREGKTALFYATGCEYRSFRRDSNDEIIRLLIAAKANVNAADNAGATAIMDAAACDSDAMKRLIAAKADVNAKDREGTTALMRAAESHNLRSIRMLIAARANINAKDNAGMSVAKRFHRTLSEQTPDDAGIGDILRRAGAK